MLTFVKRPRRDQTIVADRKLWTSRCRQYRVAFSRCRYGPRDERACHVCANTLTRSSEIRRLSAEKSDGEEFVLSNPAPKPKLWQGGESENTRQTVLLSGLDCLPGQQDLLRPMARLGKPVVVPNAESPLLRVDRQSVVAVAKAAVGLGIDGVADQVDRAVAKGHLTAVRMALDGRQPVAIGQFGLFAVRSHVSHVVVAVVFRLVASSPPECPLK